MKIKRATKTSLNDNGSWNEINWHLYKIIRTWGSNHSI